MCSNLCVFVKQQRGGISEESTISSNGIVKKKRTVVYGLYLYLCGGSIKGSSYYNGMQLFVKITVQYSLRPAVQASRQQIF